MFVQGQLYRRRELHKQFGGQLQGGISTPARSPFIFLFTGESGKRHGYPDRWTSDGVFYYAGEGQVGDMEFKAGNAAIRDHLQDGKDLHLFTQLGKGQVRYEAALRCIGFHYETTKGTDGKDRKAIIFELVPTDEQVEATLVPQEDEPLFKRLRVLSIAELRTRALASSAPSRDAKERKTLYRERSVAIKLYARKRAGGVCEGCKSPAPFKTAAGEPFLEVHHIHRLSDGGPDDPRFVAAICPNCHRKAHLSEEAASFKEQLSNVVRRLEEDGA